MTPGHSGLTDRAVSGVLWMGSGKLAYAAMQLLVLAVLGRALTPTDFGVVSAALIVIAFSGIVSQLGLGPALVQRVELEPRHIHTALSASVFLGLVLGATVWLFAPLTAAFFNSPGVPPVVRALALVFPLQGLATVAESLARRELQFRWLAQLDVKAYTFGYGLVALPLALMGWGVWALVMGEIVEAGCRTLLLLLRFRPPLARLPERRAFAELMYFGGGFTVAKVANFFAVRGDNLMVGHLLGPAALGLYGRAYQLMAAPTTGFGTVLDQVLFASMARVQTEVERVRSAYRRGITLMALLILPASAVFVVLAPEIIHVVLGPRWAGVVAPFRILAVVMLFHTNSKIGDCLARATGAVYRRAWRQVLYALLVLTGAYIGQHWYVAGVACGVALAITVNFVLMSHLSLRLTGMTWVALAQAHIPAVLIATASSLLVWAGATTLRSWGASPVIIVIATTALALACVTVLIRLWPRLFLGPYVRWMLNTLERLLPPVVRRRRVPSPSALDFEASRAGGAQ